MPFPDFVNDRSPPDSPIAPSVSCALALPLLTTSNVASPDKVVAPKVVPAVPLVALAPAVTDNSADPISSAPKVWVTPLPPVLRSDAMVAFPPTLTCVSVHAAIDSQDERAAVEIQRDRSHTQGAGVAEFHRATRQRDACARAIGVRGRV